MIIIIMIIIIVIRMPVVVVDGVGGEGCRGINVEITSVMHNLNPFRVKRVIVSSFLFLFNYKL
jgi:hypothetical protein